VRLPRPEWKVSRHEQKGTPHNHKHNPPWGAGATPRFRSGPGAANGRRSSSVVSTDLNTKAMLRRAPCDLAPLRGLRGYGSGHVVRLRQSETAFGEILGVCGQSLLDASRDLLASPAKRDDPRDVWEVSPPLAILGLLVDDHVLAQRKCSKPLAFLMLPSVPTGTVALPLPATTIRSGRCGCAHTSWEPRWRTTSQPASFSAARTSRYFFGIDQNRTRGSGHGSRRAEGTERRLCDSAGRTR
jgi:hypothetical protein